MPFVARHKQPLSNWSERDPEDSPTTLSRDNESPRTSFDRTRKSRHVSTIQTKESQRLRSGASSFRNRRPRLLRNSRASTCGDRRSPNRLSKNCSSRLRVRSGYRSRSPLRLRQPDAAREVSTCICSIPEADRMARSSRVRARM